MWHSTDNSSKNTISGLKRQLAEKQSKDALLASFYNRPYNYTIFNGIQKVIQNFIKITTLPKNVKWNSWCYNSKSSNETKERNSRPEVFCKKDVLLILKRKQYITANENYSKSNGSNNIREQRCNSSRGLSSSRQQLDTTIDVKRGKRTRKHS